MLPGVAAYCISMHHRLQDDHQLLLKQHSHKYSIWTRSIKQGLECSPASKRLCHHCCCCSVEAGRLGTVICSVVWRQLEWAQISQSHFNISVLESLKQGDGPGACWLRGSLWCFRGIGCLRQSAI
jgi:hypothetical protein